MNNKIIFRPFLISNFKGEEKFLNDMSKLGYLFNKNILRMIYIFTKNTDDSEYTYKIDIHAQHSHDKNYYFQLFRDLGWENVFNRSIIFNTNLSYFRKVYESNDTSNSIYTDSEFDIDTLKILRKIWIPIYLFLTIAVAFCVYINSVGYFMGTHKLSTFIILLSANLATFIIINLVTINLNRDISKCKKMKI